VNAEEITQDLLQQRVSMWVESVQANAPGGLLLPVMTHCATLSQEQLLEACQLVVGEISKLLKRRQSIGNDAATAQLQLQLDLLQSHICTDASTYGGYTSPLGHGVSLVEQLEKAATSLPYLTEEIPKLYLQLESCLLACDWSQAGGWLQSLEQLKQWTKEEETLKLSNIGSIPGMLQAAVQCLHYRGTVLHYCHHPELREFAFLSPQV
jgi:hypothetical protein